MMNILINEEKEKYLLELAKQGAKLPFDYNLKTLKVKEEETETTKLQKTIQALQEQLSQLVKAKDKPKAQFNFDEICPFPFDKGLHLPPFPKGIKIPKYDKYLGTTDPQDHLHEFGALSVEFVHDQTYLLRLFPHSLGGPAMEWFSHLTPGIKTFEELAKMFLQHYSHNIQHL